MILPILLDGAAASSDPLALIIAAGSAAITLLLGVVCALVASRASKAEDKIEKLDEADRQLWLGTTQLDGRLKTVEKGQEALERNTLTKEVFEGRMLPQDKKLERIDDRVEKITSDMSARPTRSEMKLPAARTPIRDERVERVDLPSDPPPMRPRLPSRR